MKQFGKRTLILLLVLAMTASLAACGSTNVQKETDIGDTTLVVTETVPVETEPSDLPEWGTDTDWEGRDVRIWSVEDHSAEFLMEEQSGNLQNDVVYERNGTVEEVLDVQLTTIAVPSTPQSYTELQSQVLSGDNVYNLVNAHAYKGHLLIMNDCLLNWHDVEDLNMDKPWWNVVSNAGSTFYDTLYLSTGAANLSGLTYSWNMFLNYRLADAYLDGGTAWVQQQVLEGKWTLDMLEEMTSAVYTDLDGNGERDITDEYGFMAFWSTVDPIFAAFGESMTGKTNNGDFQLTYMSEKTVDMYNRMYKLIYQNEGTFAAPEDFIMTRNAFIDGGVLLIPGLSLFAFGMSEMEDDYGILPYPKWEESQEGYYTTVSDGASMLGIPVTAASDAKLIGDVSDALHYYSLKEIQPVYLDLLLKNRYTRDENTAKVIDLFINNKVYEFAVQFSELGDKMFNRLFYLMRDCISSKKDTIVSNYERIENRVLSGAEEIMEHYR